MFYGLQLLIKLLKQIYFDRKEEADVENKEFNPNTWLRFILTLVALILVFILSFRIVSLAGEYRLLQEKLEVCQNNLQN